MGGYGHSGWATCYDCPIVRHNGGHRNRCDRLSAPYDNACDIIASLNGRCHRDCFKFERLAFQVAYVAYVIGSQCYE
ncbi:hypothetical protein BV20DRAFT_968059 [Pilatotrama ljubarskyi]|nr:hypothetical protein BV20DRAFT_968059 [Pilatotrama ljubarskyi]